MGVGARTAVAVLLLAAISLAAGCGEDPVEKARADVRDTYQRYVTALAQGDGKTACSLQGAQAQKELISEAEPRTPAEVKNCVQAVAILYEVPAIAELNQDEADDPIQSVEVAADEARVVVSESGGFTRETELVKEGDAWQISRGL